jgi:hypothetical protein
VHHHFSREVRKLRLRTHVSGQRWHGVSPVAHFAPHALRDGVRVHVADVGDKLEMIHVDMYGVRSLAAPPQSDVIHVSERGAERVCARIALLAVHRTVRASAVGLHSGPLVGAVGREARAVARRAVAGGSASCAGAPHSAQSSAVVAAEAVHLERRR